jgi:RNA polymerase sigma factor (sigma-70 family)
MSPLSLRRYRAERLLAKEFTGMRSKVLAIVRSKLRAQNVSLDVADLESAYAQAWQGLYAALLEGEEIDDAPAWLVTVTFRRAIDESRALARRAPAHEDAAAGGFDPDIDGVLEARARLAHVFEGFRGRLSERERRVASLCYLQGLSRAEAAARLGVSEARMRKLMDGASPSRPGVAGKVGELLASISAERWCEEQSSLMRAFAFGILDPDGPRHALAVAHCRECPPCRAHVSTLRGLASVLPPLPIPLALAASTSAGAGAVASAGKASPVAPVASGRLASGLGSSLAVKPAVCALVVLAGAYAAASSGPAHGSSPARAGAVSLLAAPAARQANTVSGLSPRRVPTRSRGARRAGGRHSTRAPGSERPTGSAAREFGPEQLPAAPAGSAVGATAQRGARGGAAREFGFQ